MPFFSKNKVGPEPLDDDEIKKKSAIEPHTEVEPALNTDEAKKQFVPFVPQKQSLLDSFRGTTSAKILPGPPEEVPPAYPKDHVLNNSRLSPTTAVNIGGFKSRKSKKISPIGGKKSRKQRKQRKSRKFRKSRKQRKQRKIKY